MVDDLGLRVPEGPGPRAFGFLMAGVAAVVLAIFFFLVLTPMAIVLRLARRDRLAIRSPEGRSYWRNADEPGGDWSRPL